MRKVVFGSIVVLFSAMLVLGGCAKQEVVKKDEPVAAAVPPSAVQPEPAKPVVQEEPVAAQPIKEAPVTASEEQAPQASTVAASESLFEKVYFDFDSSALSQKSRDALSKNADVLKQQADMKVQIEGNCDERGSAEYNLALGERRAKAAMHYLVNLGIPASRISTISYGEEKPADPGHDEAAWAKNRRDEFLIVK
ncbi:MAG: peptidoglycan-associated lipoprotein Pal [Geobacter sp.]|nr:peptidoglycan-associated lipoprotein Pal [Geobacter sp.]